MSPHPNQRQDEELIVQHCRGGDPEALGTLRERYHVPLVNILSSRGASWSETQDLLADLWGDCVPGPGDRPSLLEKFSGKSTLQGWLATVATHRWIDLKRRQDRRFELVSAGPDESAEQPVERLAASPVASKDASLLDLLRESLEAAFARGAPEALVLLRLVYVHHLTQRELVRMLGWSESKISRFLSEAMTQIEDHTLKELRRRDPLIQLTWDDFVELCQTQQVGFL